MDAQDGTMVAVMLSSTPADRLARARLALEGLSLGDAFGEQFFVRSGLLGQLIAERALPAPPWRFTDDTPMALSVAGSLVHFDRIDQDWLAQSFAEQYQPQPRVRPCHAPPAAGDRRRRCLARAERRAVRPGVAAHQNAGAVLDQRRR
jgi:hypothetical protein